ncbi:hypothetical protein ACFVWN_31375 [Nocardiopsis flavescens]|uniref:Uncharacterized protein n=1 Tax=Nocardiopsis flavescens TaxID=758803 RepID=A0A1M6H7G0_9ACTN|nr:hypothetical protein [Nocardiopsis flavescens]SHJ18089.1 hypothetical protein SAMN05421803_10464 [Nocardiopsis flavescens]
MPGTAPPADPRPPSALAVLSALLDRSLVQMEDATADARFYDREAVRGTADVWDNNTRALFVSALGRTRRARDRRARRALRWMADLGPARRSWMAASAAEAGYDVEPLLRPAREAAGGPRPTVVPVTGGVADDLAAGHRLDAATVSTLSVERRGTRLTARVSLTAERTRTGPAGDPAGPDEGDRAVELVVHLPEVEEVRFDTRTAPGARFACDHSGVAVSFGDGLLRGPAATLQVCTAEGLPLFLTSAEPPRAARRRGRGAVPVGGEVGGPAARAVCHLLIWTMVRIRSSGWSPAPIGVSVSALCRSLSGAGTEIAAAAAHATRGRRERAFRELALAWVRRGGAETAEHFDRVLDRVSRASGAEELVEARRLARELRGDEGGPAQRAAPDGEIAHAPSAAALRLFSYTADRPSHGGAPPAGVTLHLAAPADLADPGAPWGLRILRARTPDRVRVSTPAFHGTLRPRTIDDHDGNATLIAADGALEVRGDWS